MADSVDLIDPIESISNLPNGTPEYEKFFIFAELVGERRERSVLTLNKKGGNRVLETQLNGSNVNMLGVDFKKDKNRSATFTTKWTNNETNTETLLEGFGITKIDVTIDSSFIPKVNIEFVDIRGMTFFNLGDNSPYSLIFDFPPPVFNMTLKGYYGKSLDYDLHLVKHHTRFDSNDGNYYINVEFVARTFAPLADVPFKFAEIVSLMTKETRLTTDTKIQESASGDLNNPTNADELNFNPKIAPRNIYELVKKLERLTDELKDTQNTSKEAKEFDDAKQSYSDGEDIVRFMNSFSSNLGDNFSGNGVILMKNDEKNPDSKNSDVGGEFRVLNSINQYRDIIKSSNDSGNNFNSEDNKLYLGVLNEKIREGNNVTANTSSNVDLIKNTLVSYTKKLVQKGEYFAPRNIKEGIIKEPKTIYNRNITNSNNDQTKVWNNFDKYYAIDVTKFFIELDKILKNKRNIVAEKKSELVTLINSNIKKTLGFKPSIYNIFKILCDDVDKFFKELGSISYKGETHHNQYFNLIIDQIQENKSKNVTKKIYPFPLYIESDTTCGVTRKVRRIPPDNLPTKNNPFPEVVFINNFIDRMVSLKKEEDINDLKTQIDVTGNNRWIPITPADSELNGGTSYGSPYANIENITFPTSDNTIINEIYNRLINRFYIASQYTYGNAFYSVNEKSSFLYFWRTKQLKRSDLINMIAESEAINVANSIINDDILESLISSAEIFSRDTQAFYNQINKLPIYNTIPNDEVLKLSDDVTLLYRDRSNSNFNGCLILDQAPTPRVNNENSTDPIDIFLNIDEPLYRDIFDYFSSDKNKVVQNFTKENIPYFPDYDGDSDYNTRFLNGIGVSTTLIFFENVISYTNIYIDSNTERAKFDKTILKPDRAGLLTNGDFSISLSTILSIYNTEIKEFLTGNTYQEETKAFVLASMFGRARSYFSKLGAQEDSYTINEIVGDVNSRFLNPAVVEVPRFSLYYMGALLEYNEQGTVFNEIKSLLESNDGDNWFRYISVKGLYIEDDAEKISNLSINDGNKFSNYYINWRNTFESNSGYSEYKKDLLRIIDEVIDNPISDLTDNVDRIVKLIKDNNYRSIDNDMVAKAAIVNYSEYTFSNDINTNTAYIPLSTTNADTGGTFSISSANNLFFTKFWKKLKQELPDRKKELNEIESDFKSVVNDEDIKTQLYYSFKNISDKWVSGIDTSLVGFPLNSGSEDSLIKKFAFVDRAMNPIGDDVIINAESLIEMSKDYDLSMFQVFSRLLSLNGFEFFPLQNFMVFDNKNGSWKDAFKTFTTLEQQPTPAFICMYIGGTSSTLENVGSSFDNDGILDLEGEGLSDFSNVGDCEDSQEVKDSNSRPSVQGEAKFKYSEPKAFRVRFAEQNQSFFTNIEIEGREFTETADSLAILSRIAGDGKTTAPVPKGQNMFSTYENRAYSVTVTMLGNVMIQPTQYFQLENIPMYSGAYLITKVVHKVTANHMVTIFSGTKILKYPNPFVKSFATLVGIDGGTSEDISADTAIFKNQNLEGDLISAKTLINKDSGIYYNEQFRLKISP